MKDKDSEDVRIDQESYYEILDELWNQVQKAVKEEKKEKRDVNLCNLTTPQVVNAI